MSPWNWSSGSSCLDVIAALAPATTCALPQVMAPPANYKPVIDPAKKLMATPTPMMTPFYAIPEENNQLKKDMPVALEGLPEMKPEDMQYFSKLLQVGKDGYGCAGKGSGPGIGNLGDGGKWGGYAGGVTRRMKVRRC